MSIFGFSGPYQCGHLPSWPFDRQQATTTLNKSSIDRQLDRPTNFSTSIFNQPGHLGLSHKELIALQIENNHLLEGNLRLKALPYSAIAARKKHRIHPFQDEAIKQNPENNLNDWIRPSEKKKREKRSFQDLSRDQTLDCGHALCSIRGEKFAYMSLQSREGAIALQQHIMSCHLDCIQRLASLAAPHIAGLIVHSIGNYILQRLISRRSSISQIVVPYCKSWFKDLAANEYASRVMQRLIETDPEICSFSLGKFRQDLPGYISSFSSVFLVSVAVRHACSEGERNIFRYKVLRNLGRYMANKYFKRVVISFISACDPSACDWLLAQLASIYPTSADFFKDKYSVLILVIIIEKPDSDIEKRIIRELSSDPSCLLREELFLYFVQQLAKKESTSAFQQVLSRSLRSTSQFNIIQVQSEAAMYSRFSQALILLRKIDANKSEKHSFY